MAQFVELTTGRSLLVFAVAVPCLLCLAGRLTLGAEQGVESGDPNVGLLRAGGDQVQRCKILAVDDGESAVDR